MFPRIVKKEDVPGPGSPLVWKRREPVNIWQDESAPIEDFHFANNVDFRLYELSQRFLDSTDYQRVRNMYFDAIRRGNARIEKLFVDTFIANVLQAWSYPMGDRLFQFFTKDDSYVPEEAFSKIARGFYLKDGEIRKRLLEFGKWVRKYYVNRIPYLTNDNHHEVIGQSLELEVPKWNEFLVDRSTEDKFIGAVRNWYLTKDSNGKLTKVGFALRRLSVECLACQVFATIRRMLTDNIFNWCGFKYGQDNKDVIGYDLRCKPQNLIVLMNWHDLDDIERMLGSQVLGPFTEQRAYASQLQSYRADGVNFHGVDFILPGFAIVLDRICFRLITYFNELFSEFFPYDLVDASIHHIMKKIVLYRYVACNVIELGKDQKYALPLAWASEHLPFLREQS